MIGTTKDKSKLILDLIFYGLAFVAFYHSVVASVVAMGCIVFLYRFSRCYDRDPYADHLNSLIDFLNQVNSNLSTGMSLESSIMEMNPEQIASEPYLKDSVAYLQNAISIGINGSDLLDEIDSCYPIEDCRLYTEMLRTGKRTGASVHHITEVTLSNLYTRFQTVSEAQLILYQKKMEQMILCVAPILIIMFIDFSSGELLEMLYDSLLGRGIMTLSFGLLILMKSVGRKIVESIR